MKESSWPTREQDIPVITRIAYKTFYYYCAGMVIAGAVLFSLYGKTFEPLLITGCIMSLPQIIAQIWYSKKQKRT